jgi:hypothetical protein
MTKTYKPEEGASLIINGVEVKGTDNISIEYEPLTKEEQKCFNCAHFFREHPREYDRMCHYEIEHYVDSIKSRSEDPDYWCNNWSANND